MATVNFQYGGVPGAATVEENRYNGLSNQAANQAAPTTDFSGGTTFANAADQSRGGATDALSLMRQRAMGDHSASDAMARQANTNAVGQQNALINSGRGAAGLAGAGQRMAASGAGMTANNENNMRVNNAQDTALAQNQLAQGYGALRSTDAQAQAQQDARSQYLSNVQEQQNAMNQRGALGYAGLNMGVQGQQLQADEASAQQNLGTWTAQSNTDAQSQQGVTNAAYGVAGGGSALGGAGATYIGPGSGDPSIVSAPNATAAQVGTPDVISDARSKERIESEDGPAAAYARRVMDIKDRTTKTASEQMLDGIGSTKSFEYKPGFENPGQTPGERNYGTTTQDLKKSPMGASLLAPQDASGIEKVDVRKAAMASLGAAADMHKRLSALEYASKVNGIVTTSTDEAKTNIVKEDPSKELRAEGVTNEKEKDALAQDAVQKDPVAAARVEGDDGGDKHLFDRKETPIRQMHWRTRVANALAEHNANGTEKMSPEASAQARANLPYPGFKGVVMDDPVVKTDDERTPLNPRQEQQFRAWAKAGGIKDVDHPDSHYDYRGAFLSGVKAGPDAHWPDTFKQHGHPTFSEESRYSSGPGDGGTWNGDTFVPGQDKQMNEPGSADLAPAPARTMEYTDRGGKISDGTLQPVNSAGLLGEQLSSQAPVEQLVSQDPGTSRAPAEVPQAPRIPIPAPGQGKALYMGNNPYSSTNRTQDQVQADFDKVLKKPSLGEKPEVTALKALPTQDVVVPGNETSSDAAPVSSGEDAPNDGPDFKLRSLPTQHIAAADSQNKSDKTVGMYNKAFDATDQANTDINARAQAQSKEEQGLAQTRIDSAKAAQEDFKRADEEHQGEATQIRHDYSERAKDLANYHEDPNRFWNSRNTAQKVSGFLGIALGGFLQGATGRGNPALEMIDKAVDQDIAAQRHEYEAKKDSLEAQRSSFGMAMEQFHDKIAATNVLRMAAYDRVQADAEMMAAKNKGTVAQNNFQMVAAHNLGARAQAQDAQNTYVKAHDVGGGQVWDSPYGPIRLSDEDVKKQGLHLMNSGNEQAGKMQLQAAKNAGRAAKGTTENTIQIDGKDYIATSKQVAEKNQSLVNDADAGLDAINKIKEKIAHPLSANTPANRARLNTEYGDLQLSISRWLTKSPRLNEKELMITDKITKHKGDWVKGDLSGAETASLDELIGILNKNKAMIKSQAKPSSTTPSSPTGGGAFTSSAPETDDAAEPDAETSGQ